MRETGGLQFARVPEQRARGAQRRPIARLHPKPVERSQPERARQVLAGELGVELPDLAFGPGGPIRERRDAPVRRHDFGRLVARQRGRELFGRHGLEHELAGRQVESGDPRGDAAGIHRHQEVVAVLLEPVVREDGARCDRLHNLATHQALRELRILDLLADRHAVPFDNQAPDVFGGGLHGDAGEGHVRRAAVVARREREAKLSGGEARIVLEHLVEVAHPEKQDRVGVPRFDLAVLLHERGVGLDPRRHNCSTTNG